MLRRERLMDTNICENMSLEHGFNMILVLIDLSGALVFLPQATVSVIPAAASLILKALKEPPRDRKKVQCDDMLLASCVSLDMTRASGPGLTGAPFNVLGTAVFFGVLLDAVCSLRANRENFLP